MPFTATNAAEMRLISVQNRETKRTNIHQSCSAARHCKKYGHKGYESEIQRFSRDPTPLPLEEPPIQQIDIDTQQTVSSFKELPRRVARDTVDMQRYKQSISSNRHSNKNVNNRQLTSLSSIREQIHTTNINSTPQPITNNLQNIIKKKKDEGFNCII